VEGEKQMRLAVKLVVVLGVTSLTVFGSSFTFSGPDAYATNPAYSTSFPTTTGLCNPTSAGCIKYSGGDPTEYVPLSATITVTGTTLQFSETTFAPTSYSGYGPNAFGDALFQWTPSGSSTPTYWGISLGVANGTDLSGQPAGSAIDGLTLGDLYEGSSLSNYQNIYLFSNNTPPGVVGGTAPVLLNQTNLVDDSNRNDQNYGSPLALGTTTSFSICDSAGCTVGSGPLAPACTDMFGTSSTCSGFDLWTITDDITLSGAGLNFLSNGSFAFEVASYVCANGLIIGNSSASSVPEPRGVVFMGAALLLLAGCIKRLRTKTA